MTETGAKPKVENRPLLGHDLAGPLVGHRPSIAARLSHQSGKTPPSDWNTATCGLLFWSTRSISSTRCSGGQIGAGKVRYTRGPRAGRNFLGRHGDIPHLRPTSPAP